MKKLFYYEPVCDGASHSTVNIWLPQFLGKVYKVNVINFAAPSSHLKEIRNGIALYKDKPVFLCKQFKARGSFPEVILYFERLVLIARSIIASPTDIHVIATSDYTVFPVCFLILLLLFRHTSLHFVLHKPKKVLLKKGIMAQAWKKLLALNRVNAICLSNEDAFEFQILDFISELKANIIFATPSQVAWPFTPNRKALHSTSNSDSLILVANQDIEDFRKACSLESSHFKIAWEEGLLLNRQTGDIFGKIIIHPSNPIGIVDYLYSLDRVDYIVVNQKREQEYLFASGLRTDAVWAKKGIIQI